jgi:hypothetical protein
MTRLSINDGIFVLFRNKMKLWWYKIAGGEWSERVVAPAVVVGGAGEGGNYHVAFSWLESCSMFERWLATPSAHVSMWSFNLANWSFTHVWTHKSGRSNGYQDYIIWSMKAKKKDRRESNHIEIKSQKKVLYLNSYICDIKEGFFTCSVDVWVRRSDDLSFCTRVTWASHDEVTSRTFAQSVFLLCEIFLFLIRVDLASFIWVFEKTETRKRERDKLLQLHNFDKCICSL